MAKEKVQAKHTKSGRIAEVQYDFGDGTLAGMVSRFGEAVVLSNAKQSIRISLQTRLRSAMDAEKPADDKTLQADADSWKPGVASTVRKSPEEKAKEALARLSPEERKALIASMAKAS